MSHFSYTSSASCVGLFPICGLRLLIYPYVRLSHNGLASLSLVLFIDYFFFSATCVSWEIYFILQYVFNISSDLMIISIPIALLTTSTLPLRR